MKRSPLGPPLRPAAPLPARSHASALVDPRWDLDLDPPRTIRRAHVDSERGAGERLLEADIGVALDVLTAPRHPAPGATGGEAFRWLAGAPAEELLEEVAEGRAVAEHALELVWGYRPVPETLVPLEGIGAWATGALPLLVLLPARTELVVLLALLGIAEDLVGLVDLLESIFGSLVALVHIRVVLAGELAEGGADLLVGGGPRNAQDRVVVLESRWHLDRRYLDRATAKPGTRGILGRSPRLRRETSRRRHSQFDPLKRPAVSTHHTTASCPPATHSARRRKSLGAALFGVSLVMGFGVLSGPVSAAQVGFSETGALPGLGSGKIWSLAVEPSQPNTIVAGTDNGVYVSHDTRRQLGADPDGHSGLDRRLRRARTPATSSPGRTAKGSTRASTAAPPGRTRRVGSATSTSGLSRSGSTGSPPGPMPGSR